MGGFPSPLEIGGIQRRGIAKRSQNMVRPNENYHQSRMMKGGYNNGLVRYVGTIDRGRGKGRGRGGRRGRAKGRTGINCPFNREKIAKPFIENSENSLRDNSANLPKTNDSPVSIKPKGAPKKKGRPKVQKNDAKKLKQSVVEVNETKNSPTTSVEGSQRKRGRQRLRKNDILKPSSSRLGHVSSRGRQRQLLVWSGDSFNKVSSDELAKRKLNKSVVEVDLSESDSDGNDKTAKNNSAENSDDEWESDTDSTTKMTLKHRRKNYSYNAKTGIHRPGCFECENCGKQYKYIRGLRLHQRYACSNKPKFTCCYCLQSSVYKHNLKQHVEKFHGDKYKAWLKTNYKSLK